MDSNKPINKKKRVLENDGEDEKDESPPSKRQCLVDVGGECEDKVVQNSELCLKRDVVMVEKGFGSLWSVKNFDLSDKGCVSTFLQLPLIERPPIFMMGKECHAHRSVGFIRLPSFNESNTKGIHDIYSSVELEIDKICHLEAYAHILKLASLASLMVGHPLDMCYVNYYADGSDYIGAHSDKEVEDDTAVVSISYGTTRLFRIRGKTSKAIVCDFAHEPRSLLVMDGKFQKNYTHEIPIQKKVKSQRLSLTFRKRRVK